MKLRWTIIACIALMSISIPVQAISVITNASVDRNELQLTDLRAIFTMKKRQWSDGQAIQVYVLSPEQSAHRTFCKEVLGVFPRQLQSIWHRLVYSGTGHAPIEVQTEQQMLQLVSSTEGAIGYIRRQDQSDENVKILHIDK